MIFLIGQGGVQWTAGEPYERPHVLVTSPGSPERPRAAPPMAPSVGGRIQLRLGFDPNSLQLLVTVVCAAGLIPRSPHQQRNPYCKLFLLPDRSEKSKRRTRTLAGKYSLISKMLSGFIQMCLYLSRYHRPNVEPNFYLLRTEARRLTFKGVRNNRLGLRSLRRKRFSWRNCDRAVASRRTTDVEDARTTRRGRAYTQRALVTAQYGF